MLTIFETAVIGILLFLLAMVVWSNLKHGKTSVSTIPGIPPSNPKTGNLDDINEAGSLQEFLMKLHAQFGDIVSFWMDQEMVVSIASPELFQKHSKLFDRPKLLFEFLEPLLSSSSIQYTNGPEGRKRRNMTDPAYSHTNVHQEYLPMFLKIGEALTHKWIHVPEDQHLPLMDAMFGLALRSIAEASFGKFFADEKEISRLKQCYNTCMDEVAKVFVGDGSALDSENRRSFDESKKVMVDMMKKTFKDRKSSNDAPDNMGDILIDVLLKSGEPEDVVFADAITYFIGGFHTTGLMMTWAVYYLALHEDVQEHCHDELIDILGDEPLQAETISQLVYLRQVLDETIRCCQLAPFAARNDVTDTELAGHIIPAGTPVVHALGVALHNERIWKEPTRFDPDRFSPENRKKLPPYAFEPFGFAGKRKCPGYRFSYVEGAAFFSVLLRKFKFRLVPGQTVTKVYGLVTRPKDEIWITIEQRK